MIFHSYVKLPEGSLQTWDPLRLAVESHGQTPLRSGWIAEGTSLRSRFKYPSFGWRNSQKSLLSLQSTIHLCPHTVDGPAKSCTSWKRCFIPLFKRGFNIFQPSQIGGLSDFATTHRRSVGCPKSHLVESSGFQWLVPSVRTESSKRIPAKRSQRRSAGMPRAVLQRSGKCAWFYMVL